MTDTAHLRVYPNPWHTFDHEGLPCGTVPFDPVHGAGSRRWVGATMGSAVLENKPKELMRVRSKDGPPKTLWSEEPVFRFKWAFELNEPSIVLDNPHYVTAIKNGELLPADEACAARAGVPFLPREEALLKALRAGVAKFANDTGAPPDLSRWPEALRLDALRQDAPVAPTSEPKNALRSLPAKPAAQPS